MRYKPKFELSPLDLQIVKLLTRPNREIAARFNRKLKCIERIIERMLDGTGAMSRGELMLIAIRDRGFELSDFELVNKEDAA